MDIDWFAATATLGHVVMGLWAAPKLWPHDWFLTIVITLVFASNAVRIGAYAIGAA